MKARMGCGLAIARSPRFEFHGKRFLLRDPLRFNLDQPRGFDPDRRPAMATARAGVMDGCLARRIGNDKAVANRGAVLDLQQGANVLHADRAARRAIGPRLQKPLTRLYHRQGGHGPRLRILGVPRHRKQDKRRNRQCKKTRHSHAPMSAAGKSQSLNCPNHHRQTCIGYFRRL